MPQPSQSSIIGIIIFGTDNTTLEGVTVTLTLNSETLTQTSNSTGEVGFDIGNFSTWSEGDIAIVTATLATEGTITQDVILSSKPQNINLKLAETSDLIYSDLGTNSHVLNFSLLTSFDGEKITSLNPLPTYISKPKGWANATKTITYDGNNNPTTITIEVDSGTYVKTITWDVNNNPTVVTGWVKQ